MGVLNQIRKRDMRVRCKNKNILLGQVTRSFLNCLRHMEAMDEASGSDRPRRRLTNITY